MRALVSILSLAAAISFALPAQANVLVVSSTGTYTTIQQAIDAAVDDDVILVKTGNYPAFVVRGKSLVIAEDTGHTVQVDGAMRVLGIDGTRMVHVIGLSNLGTNVPSADLQYGLRVVNSSGLVFVQDCFLRGAGRPSLATDLITKPRPALLVENSYAVVLSRCTVLGGPTIPGVSPNYPNAGLPYVNGVPSEGAFLYRSGVSFFECTVTGGPGTQGFIDGSDGGHGIWSSGSALYASATTVQGGAGGFGNCAAGCFIGAAGGDGGHGLLVQNRSAVNAVGGSWSGGAGGQFFISGSPGGGTTNNCQFFGCSPSSPSTNGLATRLLDTSVLTTQAGPARLLNSPSVLRETQSAGLTFDGAVGDRVVRYSSRRGAAEWSTKTQSIQVPAPGPSFRITRTGTIGPAPVVDSIPVPDLGAGVLHRLLHYQGEHDFATGRRLGTPRVVLMLDSSL